MKELFAISQYCTVHNIDPSFINSLENEGLIKVSLRDEDRFVEEEDLLQLETFTRWHQDFGINVEGIDVIHRLLEQLKDLHLQMEDLRHQVGRFRQDD